ncbi:hypothetical protein COCCADRAFT_100889 [Bipolaris zeicola 26-R-13]|uniref:dolichol kinase n=1 Tax=Cochliobolus carbonum (strain 26-R-13) TaxID=930089 RepID=W6Y0U4_COCC2|nr:uncharacterized protein COCCADRAFT_100889 [Bipolaris zeicola 26-R-13]EUC31593.1 hypothetical protein COCCADRAFT_100889 [Bipolaris zeicola 26-R-13]
MSQDTGQVDQAAPALAPTDIEDVELFRRSPHPYLRHGDEIRGQYPERAHSLGLEPPSHADARLGKNGAKRREPVSQSPSESGTEADDEGYNLVKALPAPPLRLHKGLRNARPREGGQWASPLLTPTQIDDEGSKFSDEFANGGNRGKRKGIAYHLDEEARAAKQKYLQRRRNEMVRRATETALLAGIGILAVHGCECWSELLSWHRAELLTHTTIIVILLGLYPLRLLYYSWGKHSNLALHRRIHVPAAFDPATILYPPILPVLIAISLFASSPKPLLPNILLGLAALPARIIPFNPSPLGYSSLHWLISILPLIAAENTDIPSRLTAEKPYKLKLPPPHQGLDPEVLVCLFPLHQALLPPLYYLTTTSLLPTELHLLSIGLINLLLFSDSPQAIILSILLWMGGLGVFVCCGKVLKWGVALARIPQWRLRRAGQVIRARQSFLEILNKSLGSRRNGHGSAAKNGDSDADDDDDDAAMFGNKTEGLKIDIPQRSTAGILSTGRAEPQSAAETTKKFFDKINGKSEETFGVGRTRRNTLPILSAENQASPHRFSHRKRSRSIAQSYLELTPAQATLRKWLYAAYFYLVVVILILGPIRYAVSKWALYGQEPFGWAISYLFGNLPSVRWKVFEWNLDWWIALPLREMSDDMAAGAQDMALGERVGLVLLGEANTRLLLCMYCMGTIAAGLVAVFSLSAVVEVDTRRKVFHGTMVAMLLPTIYVDPCFVALALALVLAIFILLDLIRASQLPPLSKPIARFLTPYVDGRDLRGPVVVSHIFLLIGCAIPLWLSLAGVDRSGGEPWREWGVKNRDISMVSGVVCVGMGDAAASLIGRRYGRRRWPWAGGKSLEGSLAFAVAVTVGLVFGKAWLYFGWGSGQMVPKTVGSWVREAAMTMGKAGICAAGASLNEAVLTGGNDNVIVPVVLWVLVRGVRL